MKAGTMFLAMLAVSGAVLAGTNDLDAAREALRDGLWSVARTHASRARDDAGRLIVLETYAQEGNWRELLKAIDAMGYPSGEGYSYYRAAALFNDGSIAAASNILAEAVFTNRCFISAAARLRAEFRVAAGDRRGALDVLAKDGGDDVETKLMTASLLSGIGKKEDAAGIWREVMAMTNVAERIRAVAAAGLGDRKVLRELSGTAQAGTVRNYATLRLGRLLVSDASAFDEGSKIIRACVRENPDADGAGDAMMALADALLEREMFADAEKTYSDILTIWPEAAKNASLHEGRGWALSKLGRAGEALEEFRSAEEMHADPENKAGAAVKVADMLVVLGRTSEATDAYQRIVKMYPGTTSAARVANVVRLRAKEDRGRALYREFKFDEARRTFEELAAENPSRSEQFGFYCVLCAYGAGDDEKAEQQARRLADHAKDPRIRADAMHWLAKFSYNGGHWSEAGRLFLAFAEAAPTSSDAPQALVWAARAHLAGNDYPKVIATAAQLITRYPDSPARAAGMIAQGEALIELARFDEAVLVLERATSVSGVSDADRLAARILRADAFFAMGADKPARYRAALESYGAIQTGESLTPSEELVLSFKMARTLEKLKRADEAVDMYYTRVVLAYRTGRLAGTRYDEAARAAFARAAFRLADEFESRGRARQAKHVLDLVRTSDVKAAGEAANRIDKLTRKGMLP